MLYVGIVVCLRATGLLVTDHSIKPLHKREVVGVFAAMVVAVALTATVAVGIVADEHRPNRARTRPTRAATATSSCARSRSNQIVWPASHNAMSSAAYNFLGAEHTITIPEQLNAGARFLMIDAYYGYDDNGLVRTNLAGGVEPRAAAQGARRRGGPRARPPRRAHRRGRHVGQEAGRLLLPRLLRARRGVGGAGLRRHRRLPRPATSPTSSIIDVEDYVQPKDLKQALIDAGLFDRVWRPNPKQIGWPTPATTWWSTKKKAENGEPAPARS